MSDNLLQSIGIDDQVGNGAVQGEVVAFGPGRVVIDGNFKPGDGLQLRPGARVVMLTEDAIEEASNVPAAKIAKLRDEMRSNITNARDALDDLEDWLDELKT